MAIGGFDPNVFQSSQFQTPVPAPPPIPPPPLVSSDDAISGAMRSGVARSGSLPPQNWLLVKIGGDIVDPYLHAIEKGTIIVTDNQNRTQDTCNFAMYGEPFENGTEVILANGTFARRLFGGAVVATRQLPMKQGWPELWDYDCVDWWYYANMKRVFAKYLTFPADVILKDVIAKNTRGFTFKNVKAAPNITGGIEFNGDTMESAVGAICAAVDWDCYIDAHKDFHFFDVENVRARAIAPGRYHYWNLDFKTDLAQIRNRVFQKGGGGLTTAQVAPGALSIPLDVMYWYPTAGPNMRVQHGGQIIPYTGIVGNTLTIPAGAITHVIPQGDEVGIFIQVDDLDSQAEMRRREGPDSDGVHEYTAETDRRLSEDGCITKAMAEMRPYTYGAISGSYSAYDEQARSGRMVDIRVTYRGQLLRDQRFFITSTSTRVLGPKRNEKTISFGTSEKLDIFTALRGGVL